MQYMQQCVLSCVRVLCECERAMCACRHRKLAPTERPLDQPLTAEVPAGQLAAAGLVQPLTSTVICWEVRCGGF